MIRRLMLSSALAALYVPPLAAQGSAPAKWADTIAAEIEKAQIAGDTAALSAAVALASRVAIAYPNDGLILHYQGYALYRQALMQQQHQDASPTFERARDILTKSLNARILPETHILLSAVDGQLIARNPSRAMELGMQSQASTTSALRSGPANPRVWLVRGQGAMFTPAEYGGGLDVAEEYLKRAVELFASDSPKPGEPAWGKAEAYVWLGQVYEKKGDKATAADMYKKAVEISPNYRWAQWLASALK
ncbi:MAG TPA: tetratricopeptide repeat protein [Gemmatimonadaceae bacterium]|jgi:tetratricopeptide (TPR) repeat protein|nr:tetratricopeptide repeat protein [Gemmatimonadaceae bacterium]